MANKGDIIIMFSRIEYSTQRKIRLWFDYYIKILKSPLLFIKLALEIGIHKKASILQCLVLAEGSISMTHLNRRDFHAGNKLSQYYKKIMEREREERAPQ